MLIRQISSPYSQFKSVVSLGNDQFNNVSGEATITDLTSPVSIEFRDERESSWNTFYIKQVLVVNKNDLGIENLTEEQMKYYYLLYQARKNITNLENEIQNNIYTNNLYAVHLSIFTTEPTQTQMDNMLEYYLNYVNHYDFDYTLKTLTITDLFLFTGHLIVWYVIIALIKKGVKKV
jgi:hypothetical protein